MADENPHQFSTQTTGVTFGQIKDDTDFPHTGLIKSLSLMAKGNMAVKGSATDFDITQATTGNVIQVAAGRIFKDNKLTAQVVAKNFTSSAFDTTTGSSYYHLLVVDSSNVLQVRKHGSSTANKVPEYDEGDTIIAVIMFNSTSAALGSMQVQFLTTGKVENSLSVGYNDSGYTEAGSLTGDSNGITMTGLYKLDTLPTATVATDDKVIIQDTNDSDKIKTVTTQAIANLASVTNISDADGDTKIQMEESSDEDKIRFDTAGTERMIIDNVGNIGIGTNAPTELLHLSDADGTEPTILIDNTGTSGSEPELVFLRSTGTGSDSRDIGNIKFKAKDTAGNDHTFVELFVDQEDADTGTEDGRLIINATKGGTDSREMLRISGNTGIIFNNSALDVDFKVKGDGDGNLISTDAANDKVGIGTSTPNQKLTVSGSMGASGFVGAVVEVTGSPASPILNISPESHRTIIADTQTFDPAGPSGGPLALTLPAASGTHVGFEFRIIAKNSAAAADALTLNVTGSDVIIDATGATIGNSSTAFTLTTGKIYTVIHISSSQYMAIILN